MYFLTFWQIWHLLRTLWRHNYSMAILRQEIFRRNFFCEGKGNISTEPCILNGTNEKLTVVAVTWSNRGKSCTKWSFYCPCCGVRELFDCFRVFKSLILCFDIKILLLSYNNLVSFKLHFRSCNARVQSIWGIDLSLKKKNEDKATKLQAKNISKTYVCLRLQGDH